MNEWKKWKDAWEKLVHYMMICRRVMKVEHENRLSTILASSGIWHAERFAEMDPPVDCTTTASRNFMD